MRPMTQDHDIEATAEDIAIDGTVFELISAVGSFEANAEWMADRNDLPRLAKLLAALEDAHQTLTAVRRDIAPVIAELMGEQQVQIGDLKLERRGGKNRKQWQSGSLWSELVRRSRFNPETGEELSPADARERLVQMTFACVPFTGSLGWRTTALRSYGLDPDEYAEVSLAPWRVEVHTVTDEGAEQ